MAIKTSAGFTITVPEIIVNGMRITAERASPKNRPAKVFPRRMVKKETGAASSLSKVPVCFSSTMATASIEVVPNKITRDVNPDTISDEFIWPAIENAINNEMGINRP